MRDAEVKWFLCSCSAKSSQNLARGPVKDLRVSNIRFSTAKQTNVTNTTISPSHGLTLNPPSGFLRLKQKQPLVNLAFGSLGLALPRASQARGRGAFMGAN